MHISLWSKHETQGSEHSQREPDSRSQMLGGSSAAKTADRGKHKAGSSPLEKTSHIPSLLLCPQCIKAIHSRSSVLCYQGHTCQLLPSWKWKRSIKWVFTLKTFFFLESAWISTQALTAPLIQSVLLWPIIERGQDHFLEEGFSPGSL